MGKLDGKIAMVTGGATGIGAAIVEKLAANGAQVACCYNKSFKKAEILSEKLKEKAYSVFTVKVDLLNSSEIKASIDSIKTHFGHPIDILVNNAGDAYNFAEVDQMTEEAWDEIIGINLRGTFLCCKYCLAEMKAGWSGRIINMSSISARTGGGSGGTHYAASKGGIEAFTRALAKECGPYNITVNAVSPGVVYTPMHERINTKEKLEELREKIPLKRLGIPKEVADVVYFLCTEEAAYISGAIVPVNGGMRMD